MTQFNRHRTDVDEKLHLNSTLQSYRTMEGEYTHTHTKKKNTVKMTNGQLQ